MTDLTPADRAPATRDPMHLASEAAMAAVVARLKPHATEPYGDLRLGPKRAALMAVDSAAPIIRDAARAQALREAADMVANCQPESTSGGSLRALEAFQMAIAAGLRISANLTESAEPRRD